MKAFFSIIFLVLLGGTNSAFADGDGDISARHFLSAKEAKQMADQGPTAERFAASAALPAWLPALKADQLFRTAQSAALARGKTGSVVRIVIADSGLPFGASNINMALSKSCEGEPIADTAGHASVIYGEYMTAGLEFELVVLKILSPASNGRTYGNLGCLVWALEEVGSWDDGVPTVVNLSLQNYPDNPVVAQAMSRLENDANIVLIAGNNNLPADERTLFPGFYGAALKNATTVASAEIPGGLSRYSNFGSWTEIAGYGTLANGWGTSYAGPQAGLLMTALLTLRPDLSPALVEKLLLFGGSIQAPLMGLIGDPASGLDGRVLNGDEALAVLRRLEALRLLGYQPAMVRAGEQVFLSTNEDHIWMERFTGGSVQFRLIGSTGEATLMEGAIHKGWVSFSAPQVPGDYRVQIVIEGVPFGDALPITVASTPRSAGNGRRGEIPLPSPGRGR